MTQAPSGWWVQELLGAILSEWMCSLGTDISRTTKPQFHGTGKAFPRWGSEGWQSLPWVQSANDDTGNSCVHQSSSPIPFSQRCLWPEDGSLTILSACLFIHLYAKRLSGLSTVYNKHTELPECCSSSIWDSGLPDPCFSLHVPVIPQSLTALVRSIPGAGQLTAPTFCALWPWSSPWTSPKGPVCVCVKYTVNLF